MNPTDVKTEVIDKQDSSKKMSSDFLSEKPKLEKVALSKEEMNKLVDQFKTENKIASDFMLPKHQKWTKNLALYNNQKKDDALISDPTLYTVFNTLLAALYDDRMTVEFQGKEEGDDDMAKNLEDLAAYDFQVMEKSKLDYDWMWFTLFCGRGLAYFAGWDNETKTPIPEIINPITFYRDPKATSVHGNKLGRNSMRFGGREIRLTKYEMEQTKRFFNLDKLKETEVKPGGSQSQYENTNNENQGRNQTIAEGKVGAKQYSLWEWFTYYNNEKHICYFANGGELLVRIEKCDYNRWPLMEKAFSPTANDWDGVSLPDLVGDKQRMRAVLANLHLLIAQADANPMYLFDTTRISNEADLSFGFNKGIPVNGDTRGALNPLNKSQANLGVLNYLMEFADISAQKATATPEIQQGLVSKDQRTLGELNIVSQKVETRFSLIAKLFAISEVEFWKEWYRRYKSQFGEGLEKKIVRIVGANGFEYRELTKENVICSTDPDIVVTSKILSEASRIKSGRELMAIAQVAMQDPTVRKDYWLREVAKTWGWSKQKIEELFPPTPDELQAEWENEQLNAGTLPSVGPNDDHILHLRIHTKANPSDSAFSHIMTHKTAIRLKKAKPELFPNPQQAQDAQDPNKVSQDPAQAQGQSPAQNPGQPSGGSSPIQQMMDTLKGLPSSQA